MMQQPRNFQIVQAHGAAPAHFKYSESDAGKDTARFVVFADKSVVLADPSLISSLASNYKPLLPLTTATFQLADTSYRIDIHKINER
jgi:hypothetical protein